MKSQADTLEVIRLLTATKDSDVLRHIKAVLTTQEDWWDTVPEKVKDEVEEAAKQLKNGDGVPHEKVMKKFRKWL